ncbi:MAG: hypothetical protein OEW82_00750 [Dehalococcoidia bacterium]|nr:hypothetical protein [Dehalococcoidia bacterium]
MKTFEEAIGQEQVSMGQRELPSGVEELRRNVEFFSERLNRLTRLEALLGEKYRKKLEALHDEFNRIDRY